MDSTRSAEESHVARRILAWARERGLRLDWGKGRQTGSYFPMVDRRGRSYWTISVWTSGTLEVQFEMLRKLPPFDKEEVRRELQSKLNRIPGVNIEDSRLSKRPSIRLTALALPIAMDEFLNVMDWFKERIEQG